MEFCSNFGYNYGFNGSDEESYSEEDEVSKQKIKRRIRKADTNLIAIKFDTLVNATETFAGEPIYCTKCFGIMSALSKNNIDKMTWKCEFCYEANDLHGRLDDPNQIPKQSDVTYIIETAKKSTEAMPSEEKQESNDSNYLMVCIDVSGSMDTAIPVSRPDSATSQVNSYNDHFTRLKGVQMACLETLKTMKVETPNKRVAVTTFSDSVKYFGDCTKNRSNDPLLNISSYRSPFGYNSIISPRPLNVRTCTGRQPHQISTVSIKSKIKNLFVSKKKTKSDEDENEQESDQSKDEVEEEVEQVQAVEAPVDDLSSKERLLTHANNTDGNLASIKHTHPAIEQRIKFLRTEGSTALGPGLLFSVGFCAKKPGSSVILCTDGAANVGIGANEYSDDSTFYDDVSDYAKQHGVTVNVISMEGTDCKLALLGRVAERSNGELKIVNPANLSDEFRSILSNRVIAVNVMAKLIVNNKYLYIRDSALEAEEAKATEADDKVAKAALDAKRQSIITRDIGNANIDTEITYEYGFRKVEGEKPESLTELPFQVQITYTLDDGTKAMRVYTKVQKFTRKREEAEKNIASKDLLFVHGAQCMSNQILAENVSASKFRSQAMQNLLTANDMASPTAYAQTSEMVNKYSKSKKVSAMTDTEAQNFYSQAKVSRSKISKK